MISATVAKARLAEWLQRAFAGEIVVITRHGKPVAALVSPEELEQVRRLRAAGPETGLVSLAGGWSGSDELAEILDRTARSDVRREPELDSD
jgi:prevent-host-death family protein